jgi:hypothetical protein
MQAVILSARVTGPNRCRLKETEHDRSAMNEIDNHADTKCAGPNWKLLKLPGEYCNVSPFSADYQPKSDVPIAKCATVYTCQTSSNSIILVADQVLYFSDKLHCSLIHPHQIRSHGYGVCDDPWDPHWSIGTDLESIFIPLRPDGPSLCFESCIPTDWEMKYLPIIEITSSSWNPADLRMFGPHMEFTRVVDCMSSARRDIWDQSTAPLSTISPILDSQCAFFLYSKAILVAYALTGMDGNISATITANGTRVSTLTTSVECETSALRRQSAPYR